MNRSVHSTGLEAAEKEHLARIERNLPLVADVSRADAILYVAAGRDYLRVSQARPHSMAPIYPDDVSGSTLARAEAEQFEHAFATGRSTIEEVARWGDRAPLMRRVHPIRGPLQRIVGVLSVETNLIEYARHQRRHAAFQRAVAAFQATAIRREILGVTDLIPFGEQDGIVLIDELRRIRYLSGIANNFYRKLGYMDPLVGRHVEYLETGDDELVGRTLGSMQCYREEARAQEREWVRQTVPVLVEPAGHERLRSLLHHRTLGEPVPAVLLMVHDDTEMRRRQRELQVKSAMIQETHHRVKNNLQTIAALLRLESRRTTSDEAKRVLEESMNRILSISVVHEFMANQGDRLINLREVGQRLVAHMRQMVPQPDRAISLQLSGPDIYLPAQQATMCALVINELLQNAIEHGFSEESSGNVSLRLEETEDRVVVEVTDNGSGLPSDFDLHRTGSMGLNIVQVLVRDDLKGEFTLSGGDGVTATVTFPKPSAEVRRIGAD